ncbi:hypothetical protein [Vibrio sp. AND4]|uniref:hypothetical protein n=1 Tax=Vibrio sp. AND4 TaxID=314289 RepID=UPI00015F2C0E|nr:hypothetical protein [Vibrio sp. AND4]EDP57958.1 hypothetical protein AND4_05289 [Vibrio sp. AND4]
MNKEEIINHWLSEISEGQWQLLNQQCNLVGDDARHFATTTIPPENLEFMKTKPNIAYKKEDFTNDKFKPLK